MCSDLLSLRPVAVLNGRRKITCTICTVNDSEPVMIDAADQWEAHQKTRLHRRLAHKIWKDNERQPDKRFPDSQQTSGAPRLDLCKQ